MRSLPTDTNGLTSRLRRLVELEEGPEEERERLISLMTLFAELPPPPDPFGLFPDYVELKERFIASVEGVDGEAVEEAFLALYSHVHGYEVPFTPDERRQFVEAAGYLCHVGGVSAIIKAVSFIEPSTVSADFGAGNGLQTLLMQRLRPHRKTVQIEISSRLVECGRQLQRWLDIPTERVEWIIGDISDVSPVGIDLIYLYRPVRPTGAGERFYRDFGTQLAAGNDPVVILSVADCLRAFLPPQFEVFYSDGHLTCYRRSERN